MKMGIAPRGQAILILRPLFSRLRKQEGGGIWPVQPWLAPTRPVSGQFRKATGSDRKRTLRPHLSKAIQQVQGTLLRMFGRAGKETQHLFPSGSVHPSP